MLSNEKKMKMLKVVRIIKNVCTGVVCLAIFAAAVIGVYKFKNKDKINEQSEAADVFAEEMNITVYDVKHQMSPIGEMATYKYEYKGHEKIEDSIEVADSWNIPFTEHTIDIEYSGEIKAGYEMDDIDLSVDTERKVINVVLPEVQVLNNNVNTYSTIDKNNVLNPIESDEAQGYLDGVVEPKELEKAKEEGLYDKAEEHAKEIIKNQLSYFEKFGYSVEFPESISTK